MPHQIGTDEAGYGPNYGPLVITGTLWETVDPESQLYNLLRGSVTNGSVERPESQLLIADSKKVYGASKRLKNLELPVLAILYSLNHTVPTTWQELLQQVVNTNSINSIQQETWLLDRELSLPVAADLATIVELGEAFLNDCQQAEVALSKIVSVPVFAGPFNRGITEHGNKANLLSTSTLRIVRDLLDLTSEDVVVGCDKHGGRSRYGALIQEVITEEFVWAGRETLHISEYSFQEDGRSVKLRFEAKGESFLPTALASMVSKYVREVFMLIWNGFWQQHVADLKPTQGYPQDAKRFKNDINSIQTQLAIPDHQIWRSR